MPTTDPTNGIPYPLRSVAPNIADTMQPALDHIGGMLGTPPHWYEKRIGSSGVASGTNVGVLSIPAKPFASVIHVEVIGQVSNTTVTFCGLTMTASAGTITDVASNAPGTFAANAGSYVGLTFVQDVALPANTAVALTFFAFMGTGVGNYRAAATAQIYPAGQYGVS